MLTKQERTKQAETMDKNVFGEPLEPCCTNPMTGYFRDGLCRTCDEDTGKHVVCVMLTDEFLAFSQLAGNDLSTPRPEYGFQGLKGGDKWCLCALRWKEALDNNQAPLVLLEACAEEVLEIIDLQTLVKYAFKK